MIINKVEICGVNTSKLPILKNEEKGAEKEEYIYPAVRDSCPLAERQLRSEEIWKVAFEPDL